MDVDPNRALWKCGYCCIGGGPTELREAVDARRS
jgi:hypothetical protein